MDRSKLHSVYSMLILFGFIIFTNIGGCGGGNGGTDDNELEESPDFVCQSPPLNTDFSDRAVFFVDDENSVLIGISSNGEVVEFLLADIPDSGARIGLIAEPTSPTACEIIAGAIDFNMNFDFNDELLLQSTGHCQLEEEFSVMQIEDLEVVGIPLGFDLAGECDEIIFFDENTKNLQNANEIMFGKFTDFKTKELDKVFQIDEYQENLRKSVK